MAKKSSKFIRYIGSKEPIIEFLITNFEKHSPGFKTFADMFSGTNVVSKNILLLDNVIKVEAFDMSTYSQALGSFVNPNITESFIKYLNYLDNLELIESDVFNEFSIGGTPKTLSIDKLKNQNVKSRMFFSEQVGKKIDTIRTELIKNFKSGKINENTKNLVLALVLRYADSNANTTGIYGAYLKNEKKSEKKFLTEEIIDELKSINFNDSKEFNFNRMPIEESLKNIENKDIIYFDPPYNTRKYESNYQILEYISDIDFDISYIKKDTISALPSKKINNPFGQKSKTYGIFEKMISEGSKKAKVVIISYSNQGLMKQEEIQEICDKYNLELITEKMKYKKYKSHNVSVQGELFEILWIIKNK
jgi:adenine-specific DNA-methyltransferase